MPMSAAYARKLVQSGRAQLHPHYAFTVVQLAQVIHQPSLRPVLLSLVLHRHTAELFLLAEGEHTVFPLLSLVVDLYTDVPRRIRRRAAHRRRRRARGRYRPDRRHGQPFIVRRPSVAHSQRSSHRRYQRHRSAPGHISPTMHWRAQAVERVIAMVRKLVPISHVVILDPPSIPDPEYASVTPAERRRYLIDTYGTLNAQGERRAVCAYCGTTEGTIEVDHIIPESRGGTDAWSNLVPACAACNAQKGDRTPEEAGMPLRIPPAAGPSRSHRADAYRRWTARLLAKNLTHTGLRVVWTQSRGSIPQLPSSDIRHAFADVGANPQAYPMQFIAKPIARPRKQRFTARNYPDTTPLRSPYVRVGRTIKRRVRVNRALALWREDEQVVVRVVGLDEEWPEAAHQLITTGMLCEGQRAGRTVVGIVSAIHSTGRLTLLVPGQVSAERVRWQRVVISPRKHLRVLSSDRVVFLPVPRAESGGGVRDE